MRVRTNLSSSALPRAEDRSQHARRARSRAALLEATARAVSRSGYANLVLERVAHDAGYTRGALDHQFKDKDDLVLATVHWVDEAWRAEVGELIDREATPLGALRAFARGHAVFCRRDIARVAVALRVELGDTDHPVGQEVERISETGYKRVARLIKAGRQDGSIPDGPPARVLARAFVGAVEGTVIALRGAAPHDAVLAEQAAQGVLGARSAEAQ